MKYIDLTHHFTANMPGFPGDAPPELRQINFTSKVGYNEFELKTTMHIGTHMDAPLHFFDDGKFLSDYPIEKFIGKGHLIDARGKTEISPELIEGHDISPQDIVIIFTGFSEKFGQEEYYKNYPTITEEFAQKLIDLNVNILAMDTPSPDHPPFKIHHLLLEKDILIIENLTNLEKLLQHPKFNIIALPAKFDAEAAPVRVIAAID